MIYKPQFSTFGKAKSIVTKLSVALLLAALIVSTVAMPAFASSGSDEVLTTSGHIEGYYYECVYTPTHEKKKGHYGSDYHSYYVDGYHVECKYTKVHTKKHYEPKPEPKKHYEPEHKYHPPSKKHHAPKYHCTYTVYKGDTLTHIARYYGISVRHLAKANYIKNPNYIRPGQVLYVPCHY